MLLLISERVRMLSVCSEFGKDPVEKAEASCAAYVGGLLQEVLSRWVHRKGLDFAIPVSLLEAALLVPNRC